VFVRKKVIANCTYHYLCSTERADGKVRQKVVAYLGEYPSLADALEKLPALIQTCRAKAAEAEVVMEEQCQAFHALINRWWSPRYRQVMRHKPDDEPWYPSAYCNAREDVQKAHRAYWRAKADADRYTRKAEQAQALLDKARSVAGA
jgi:hypothetical protein